MYFLLLCLYLCPFVNGQTSLKSGSGRIQDVYQFNISHGINTIVVSNNTAQSITHMVIFAQSPYYEITLSLRPSASSSESAQGTSVGLVLVRDATTSRFPSEIYVISNHYSVISPVWMGITVYGETDPIPGGCNQVRPLEIEPNLSIKTAEPLMELLSFERAGTWTRKNGKLVQNSCEDSRQWTSLTYHLYAIPLANLGGQHWPPWESSSGDLLNNRGKALDVSYWPLSRQFVAMQLQLLLSPISTKSLGYHLGSYKASEAVISPPRFSIARRYANVYAFVILVERDGSQPVMYIPQMMYPCPNGELWSPYINHYNSSWSCNFILTSGFTQSISCGVAIAIGGIIFFFIALKHPRLGSSLCYYLFLCIITSALIHRFGGTAQYYSLLMGMLFGTIPFITLMNMCCCMPSSSNIKIGRRLAIWPGFLFMFLLLAGVSFTPLNTYSAMRSENIFIPVFLVIHLLVPILFSKFPRMLYSLSIGFISIFLILMGISVSFMPQSLWYLVPFDYFLNFASPNYLQVIRFNPIGIYDMVAIGTYLLLSLLLTIIIFRKWKAPSTRRFSNTVVPEITIPIYNPPRAAVADTRPVSPVPTNNQLTIICETHHYHVRDEQPRDIIGSRLAGEPSAPRSSAIEMQTAPNMSDPLNIDGGRYGAVLDNTDFPPSYDQACVPPPRDTRPPPPYAPGFRA